MQVLRIIAAVLAVGSLVATIFVRDSRLRTPGLLLSGSVVCLVFAPMLFDQRTATIISAIVVVPVVISTALNIRMLRARSE